MKPCWACPYLGCGPCEFKGGTNPADEQGKVQLRDNIEMAPAQDRAGDSKTAPAGNRGLTSETIGSQDG